MKSAQLFPHQQPQERRAAPELKPGEVLVSPGTTAEDHVIRDRGEAVKPLRDVHDNEQQLQSEVDQRLAELAEMRAKAMELQQSFEALVSERDALRKDIGARQSSAPWYEARIAELERYLEDNWQ